MEFINDDIDELKSIIKNKKILLKFYASWCKNCNTIQDSVNNYCNKYNYDCINIDIDNNESISEYYTIEKLPTIIIINEENNNEKLYGASTINEKLRILEINEINEDF